MSTVLRQRAVQSILKLCPGIPIIGNESKEQAISEGTGKHMLKNLTYSTCALEKLEGAFGLIKKKKKSSVLNIKK